MKNKFTHIVIISLSIIVSGNIVAKNDEETMSFNIPNDTSIISPDDPVMLALDNLISTMYFKGQNFIYDTATLNTYGFCPDSIPSYTDQEYSERLAALNAQTPFNLVYNKDVNAYIKVYVEKKREMTSRVLGLSQVYFPLFEEVLDRYNIPLELKYLAVIESALNPLAKSRAGAQGLWQFMYRTGKIYNLNVTSYVDERSDPYQSTVAACEYFQFLYSMYHDWNLVLAAYNCGPGNVNKAIRRSGGKTDYWEMKSFLPRETRGYVPAFIAAMYALNYASEHNLYPKAPLTTYFEYDTVYVKQQVTFEQLSVVLDIPIETIIYLNPVYKLNVIPSSVSNHSVLYLPVDKIGLFLTNEEIVYNYNLRKEVPENSQDQITEQTKTIHTVKHGEYLGYIANKYNCSTTKIIEWNKLENARIYPGQKLELFIKNEEESALASTTSKEVTPAPIVKVSPKNANKDNIYHIVQKGDTLWDIANNYKGISVTQIKKLNQNLNVNKLKPGMKILISVSG